MLGLALPMMAAHVTTPLMGLVAATAIGRLGEPSLLGAVALGAIIFDLVFWTFGGLRMATAGLTAQAVGAGDTAEIDVIAARALLLAALLGGLLVVLQVPIGQASFRLAGASPEVTAALDTYFSWRIWAAPLAFANYAILGSVLGRGRTGLGLLLQLTIGFVNIALTVLLVTRLGYGVAGAALASLAAEAMGLVAGIAVLGAIGSHPFRVPAARVVRRADLLRMVAINRDVMIRTIAIEAVYAIFTAGSARAGDLTLAANAILQNMWLTAGYLLDGFATATETLAGQALGARREADFRRAVRLAFGWCFGVGLAMALLSWLGGGAFIDAVTTSPAVRQEARRFLLFAAASPLVGAAAFMFDGVYVGATWTRALRNLMLVALAAYLAAATLAAPLGNAGAWLAILVFQAARGLLQGLAYPGLLRRTFPPRAA